MKRLRKYMGEKSAVSLIELIIAMSILCVILTAAFEFAVSSQRFIVLSKNSRQAMEFASSQLEELAGTPYSDTALDAGVPPKHHVPAPNLPSCGFTDIFHGNLTYDVVTDHWDRVTPTTASEYKMIIATVTWNDGKDHSLSIIGVKNST